jgi:hypothetical protein
MTFLQLVNRILRMNGQIRGDTDAITTFSETQHNAATQIAIVCSQDELTDLISDRLIPYERTSSTVTFVTNTMSYTLASNFVRFYGKPHFYNATQQRQIYEYPGGLETLQIQIFNHSTQYGQPNWFFSDPTTTKKVGFFQVPSSAENAQVWTYEYEKSVMISVATDTVPLHNDEEANAFAQMAGRRFKFMFEDVSGKMDIEQVLDKDVTYRRAKARLAALIVGMNPGKKYIHGYM